VAPALTRAATGVPSTLTVAVVPQFTPEIIVRTWTPLLDAVAKASGLRFTLRHYASIPDFEQGFARGEPDLVFLNPYHLVMARRAAGYRPIVRDSLTPLTGILVVRRDAPIDRVRQLQGATIAFPAPNAFGASLYLRALLSETEQIRFTPVYRKTHSNVFRHVLSGEAQAGGAIRRTLEREAPAVQDALRILYETPPAPPHPIAVHPRVPAATALRVQHVLLDLARSEAGQALLTAVDLPQPVRTDYDDYRALERLGLDRYAVQQQD
jgi:phosphonate transport system substrate-binding protein